MSNASHKVCPQCGQASPVYQAICASCGHQFRTTAPASAPTQFVSPGAPATYGVGLKSKVGAALLGLFFGCLGVHNFYLGYNGRALAELLVTVLTCGIGSLITAPVAVVEAILILTGHISTDARGLPLRD